MTFALPPRIGIAAAAACLGLAVLLPVQADTITPPDADGAVGSNHVMTVSNPVVLIQNRNGGIERVLSHDYFWTNGVDGITLAPLIGQASDPRVVYDPHEGRWIVTASGDALLPNGSLLLAVSAGDNPNGPWYRYQIPVGTNGNEWIDNPNLGFNRHWIAVHCVRLQSTTNGAAFAGQLFVFDKMNLYANGPATPLSIPLSSAEINMVPASTLDPLEDSLYVVHFPANALMPRISRISGPVGAEQFALNIATASNNMVWSTLPPADTEFAPQLGTGEKIAAQGRPFTSCLLRNGSLWFAHQIYQPLYPSTRSAIQWWQVSTGGTLLQHGQIDDSSGSAMFAMPSLAVNRHDDMLLGFSRFSVNAHVGAGYAYRAATDPPNTLRATHLFKKGEGPYDRPNPVGINLWGDHSASAVDPVDDTSLWTIQEYAAGPSNLWGTWWAKVTPPPPIDLTVSMSVSTPSAMEGDPLVYSMTISNAGPIAATNATIVTTLPPLLSFNAATASVGSCTFSNQSVTCALGLLPVGGTAGVTVHATASLAGIAETTATAFSDETDTNLLDNTASVSTCIAFSSPPEVWINEIHYEDTNGFYEVGEGVEIAGAAGTSLDGLVLTFYEGTVNGLVYASRVLSGTIDHESNGYGAVWFPVPFLHDGGFGLGGDGVSLSLPCDNTVVEFLSYEGAFTAGEGPANGLTATDIGVSESPATPPGYSLAKVGMGTNQSFFVWDSPAPASPGSLNARQFIQPPEYADLAILASVSPSAVIQGDSVVYTLTATNLGPDTAEQVALQLALPSQVGFAGAEAGDGSCRFTNQTVICEFPSPLPVGTAASVSITGRVTGIGPFRATARGYANQNDTAPSNNAATLDVCADTATPPLIWINEFHYRDSTFLDENEGVEIAGLAGSDLAGYSLVLYDGANGDPYNSIPLTGTIDDEGSGFGALWFPIGTLQEGKLFPPFGAGDGIALAFPCSGVVQFISYDGAITADTGPAAGLLSENVGLIEPANNPTNLSLQLQGAGSAYGDFSWAGPLTHSRGVLNANQVLVPLPDWDFDGIPNEWEMLHFGGPTNAVPGADADFDGFSNLEEYIADTIPTNALSFFRIDAIALTGDVVVTFHTSSNRIYDVETAAGPNGTAWSNLVHDLPGSGGGVSVTNSGAAPVNRFRAGVSLPMP